MNNLITRAEYMAMNTNEADKTAVHRRYFGQFVTDNIKRIVLRQIGINAIAKSTDKHLNDIPLHAWDNLHGMFILPKDEECLSSTVCIGKEAAKQIKEAAL